MDVHETKFSHHGIAAKFIAASNAGIESTDKSKNCHFPHVVVIWKLHKENRMS